MTTQTLSATTISLRDRLRSSTHEIHAGLDRALMPAGSSWTVARYTGFLRGTLAVLGAAEPAIARTLPQCRVDDVSRSGRLERDLRALGDDGIVDDVPLPVDLAAPAAAFGAAYVIEGSMLGGQYVAQAVARDLELGDAGVSYLRPPGVVVGVRWKAFVAALDRFGAQAAAAEWRAAEAAAAATFAAFAEAFRREGLL